MSRLARIEPKFWPHDEPSHRLQSEGEKVAAAVDLLVGVPVTVGIALAASQTTDGMDITVTALDANGKIIAGVHNLEMWMSESALGAGLTGDTYSGDLTAGTGAVIGTLTSKKAWIIQTAATGIFVATLVASANPTDQYVCVRKPLASAPVVSEASGNHWEGAA